MGNKRIYIANRFQVKYNPGYESRFNSFNFEEIVTIDSELCKRRESVLDFNGVIQSPQMTFDLSAYPLGKSDQYIYTEEIVTKIYSYNITSFEYCGIDVVDKYHSNSWITNYGVPYDLDENAYTKYGLMRDILSVEKWLTKRISEKRYKELELNEFELVAVWRKT